MAVDVTHFTQNLPRLIKNLPKQDYIWEKNKHRGRTIDIGDFIKTSFFVSKNISSLNGINITVALTGSLDFLTQI